MNEPTPHLTPEEEETLKLVLTNEGCKRDEDLEVAPFWTFTQSESRRSISPFPFLVTFINLACIAYKNHGKDETYMRGLLRKMGLRATTPNEAQAPAVLEGVPEGFELLASAEGTASGNGYYGVAYINRETTQIILSHRGTEITNWGALKTDVKSIWWAKFTPQVSSAITFAHIVAQFAQKNRCQLFFTGHSLGAWLAQITCFSVKYLTPNGNGYFVSKPPGEWDDLHPYTVAFDSPGALQFLLKIKDHLFPRNEPQSQMINVACLPVEVFQFHTNSINTVNTQIGTVYIVDLENKKMGHSYVWKPTVLGTQFQINKPLATHSIQPVTSMITENRENSETEVLRSHVIDWRVDKWDDFIKRWWNEGRSVAVELHKFPEYHLTRKELDLLKELSKVGVGGSGCYEGLFSEDENVANRIVEYCKSKEGFLDGFVRLGENVDRREVIPQVRQFAQALKNEIIWWNPTKPAVPENFIGRPVAESRHLESDGRLPSSVLKKRLEELVERLVLLVDPPGMGKSTEMSDLEGKLRKKFSSNRVILRINLNHVQMALSMLSATESASSVLLKLAGFLPANIFETAGVRVFVLLDALDEVCPTHQTTMIFLLQILNSSKEVSLRVFVTMRPHLRRVMEEEFKVVSWSLPPLTEEQQDEYMKSVLNKSSEEIRQIRSKLTASVSGLLGIPLMLSMFVDVIQSGGDFAGETLNTFELYEKFMRAKHVVYVVEKRGAKEEDNYTQMDLMNIPKRCLPFYYRAAINQLVDNEYNRKRVFRECGGIVGLEEPLELTRLELISLGLLVEGSDGRSLVFKHRSFAEFFYARLLTVEDPLQQGARDALFGNIYAGRDVLENVEAFVAASFLSKTPPSTVLPVQLLLSLSPKWVAQTDYGRGHMFYMFVKSSHLFPLLVREVLLTCVTGDARDLLEVLKFLFDESNLNALRKLCVWMSENREWTRGELLKMNQVETTPTVTPTTYPLGEARLMVAIALHVEETQLLNKEEVGVAINSCDHTLVSIVAKWHKGISGWGKWEWVEGNLPGGRSKLRELFMNVDSQGVSAIIGDVESAWKLVDILSEEEISALLTNEETRVSDICGRSPPDVVLALGEEFLPPKKLAQFRGKFGEDEGKTVFEMEEGGRAFAVKYLWGELVGEVRRRDERGPVTVALREALGRMKEDDAGKLLSKLEGQVLRRSSSCRGGQQDQKNEEEDVVVLVGGGVVVEWVAKGPLWRKKPDLHSLDSLPFVLRYWGSVDLTQIKTFLKRKNLRLEDGSEVVAVLRSLVVASSSPRVFSVLSDFLREKLPSIPPELQSLAGVFVDATREQIAEAACSHSNLVSEVSVGGVLLKLLPQLQQQQHSKATWEFIARDVIAKTPCCDLPKVLNQLRQQMGGQTEEGVGLLKKVLTSYDVLKGWSGQFNLCRVTQLLPFYFSVFGLNLQWMKMRDGVEVGTNAWVLLRNLPVEIATVLPTELLPQIQKILRVDLRQLEVVSLHGVAWNFSYETDAEWETLLPVIDRHTLPSHGPDGFKTISSAVAAPLVRTLIRLYGEEWTKQRFTPDIWNYIPSRDKDPRDSVAALGSLLHSAITLNYLEQVKKRAWPGLVKWRNAEGKSAVDVAKKKWEGEELHPIRLFLHKLTPLQLHP